MIMIAIYSSVLEHSIVIQRTCFGSESKEAPPLPFLLAFTSNYLD